MDVQDIKKMALEVEGLKAELSEIHEVMIAVHDVLAQSIATQQANQKPEHAESPEKMDTMYAVPSWIKGN